MNIIEKPVENNNQKNFTIENLLKNKLKQHYADNLFRARLKNINKQQIQQKNKLNFSSNDYLGFASNLEIIKKTAELLPGVGIGSGASNLISGYHTIHQDLENKIANDLNCQQAILFPSGFMANLAIADVLLNLNNENTIAIHDHSNHASIIDGSRLSGCKLARYKHNDLDHLKLLLNKYKDINSKFIFTESLFSMEGDFSDLNAINNILFDNKINEHSSLIIDESHSFGLYNRGKGLGVNIKNNNKLIMGTFGKALGTAGAFVAGSKITIEALVQFARPYIYTTALSPAITLATLLALRLNQQTDEFRDKLFRNIEHFCNKISDLDFGFNKESPIQPIIIGDSKKCIQAAEFCNKNGIILTAIREPTVAKNSSRLRITLSAEHSLANIDYLINVLYKLKKEINI